MNNVMRVILKGFLFVGLISYTIFSGMTVFNIQNVDKSATETKTEQDYSDTLLKIAKNEADKELFNHKTKENSDRNAYEQEKMTKAKDIIKYNAENETLDKKIKSSK